MNKISKYILSFIFLIVLMLPTFGIISNANAQVDIGLDYAEDIGLEGEKDPRDIAVNIIKLIMTFLGIIATVIILLGGFKWMTSQGSPDKVEEAKKLIFAGIIGLIIIFGAFMIIEWVVNDAVVEIYK